MYNILESQLDILHQASDSKASKMIKGGIFLKGIQFGVLFYLTYWVFDWDFCEPIDYLLGCTLETVALYMFIKYRKDFSQDDCYGDFYD